MTFSISPQKLLKRILLGLLASLALGYVADSLWFRVRLIHPKHADPLESFTGPRVLAIEPADPNVTSFEPCAALNIRLVLFSEVHYFAADSLGGISA